MIHPLKSNLISFLLCVGFLQAAREREADLAMGDGLAFSRILSPLFLGSEAPSMGKITLPASVLNELPLEEAVDRGPIIFQLTPLATSGEGFPGRMQQTAREEHDSGMNVDHSDNRNSGLLSTSSGGRLVNADADRERHAGDGEEDDGSAAGHRAGYRSTHAGVLEFTAPEGHVGLPLHVWQNLGLSLPPSQASSLPHSHSHSSSLSPLSANVKLRVRFVRLPKAKFIRLRPSSPSFSPARGRGKERGCGAKVQCSERRRGEGEGDGGEGVGSPLVWGESQGECERGGMEVLQATSGQ